MATVLYPGAFKPPHRGHFELVKNLLTNQASGRVYTLDTYKDAATAALADKTVGYDKIDKVVVFVGGAPRNGLKQSHAAIIWNIYKKHLPGNVEVVEGQMNPMLEAKDYATKNPNVKMYAVTGIRDESDVLDLKRLSTFKNTPNVEGLLVTDSTNGESIRATNFRKAILGGNLDDVTDFFPKELSRKEILQILNMLKNSIIAEMMDEKIEKIFTDMFTSDKQITEASSAPPVRHNSIIKSADRAKLVRAYNQLRDVLGDNYYQISFNQDHIRVELPSDVPNSFDYTPYMGSILEYMIDQGMKVSPLPEVVIKKDIVEAADFFGKTAYYDPNKKEIVLYVQGRHPKDVMRSFTHEMIHHIQNNEGRLNNIRTQNTNEDSYLQEIEKEAYLLGNITFRNWEDSVKNPPLEEKVIMEGKYDKFVNYLSRLAFEAFKDAYDTGQTRTEFEYTVGHPDEEPDIESETFEFDYLGVAEFTEDTYAVDGGANAGYDDEGEEINPMLAVKFKIPKNPDWQQVSFDIKDVVRHELEHLTQDGANLRQGKYMADDDFIRKMIDTDLLPKSAYFQLEKEVDAMIQGLYFKAKKSRTPFKQVVNAYLDLQPVDQKERKVILDLWRKRLPALGIRQEL